MGADPSDTSAECASLALQMGSAAVDVVLFMADLGEELPLVKPVLNTLKVIRETAENVNNNREELAALQQRCTYLAACFIAECRHNPSSQTDVTPVQGCLEAVGTFAARCSRRSKVWRIVKASNDKDDIAALNSRIDRVTGDLRLAGMAAPEGKADEMRAMLVSLPLASFHIE